MSPFHHDGTATLGTRPRGYEIVVGIVAALVGASLGLAVGGGAGAIVGLIIGAAMGAAMGWVAATRARIDISHDEKLDRDIGVSEGDIGAPNLQHPPAKIGAFSREASGAGSVAAEHDVAAGPIDPPPR